MKIVFDEFDNFCSKTHFQKAVFSFVEAAVRIKVLTYPIKPVQFCFFKMKKIRHWKVFIAKFGPKSSGNPFHKISAMHNQSNPAARSI